MKLFGAEFELLKERPEDEARIEAVAKANKFLRKALDKINNSGASTQYPHTMPVHGSRIVDEGDFSLTGVPQAKGEHILLSSPKATLKISTNPQK